MLIPAQDNYDHAGFVHRDLTRLVASLGSAFGPDDVQRNAALMRALSAPMYVASLLAEIIENERLLGQIASRSYRHVNHFEKIVLVDAQIEDGYRLTLHLWNPPYSIPELEDELIHDHRFSFWSAILVGTLRTEEFMPDESGETFNNYRYSPDRNSEYNTYKYQGSVCLKRSEFALEKNGGVYHLPYDTTHRVLIPSDEMTCTMVLRSPRARTYSNVYNTNYPSTDTSNANPRFGVAELRGHLRGIHEKVVEPIWTAAPEPAARYA